MQQVINGQVIIEGKKGAGAGANTRRVFPVVLPTLDTAIGGTSGHGRPLYAETEASIAMAWGNLVLDLPR